MQSHPKTALSCSELRGGLSDFQRSIIMHFDRNYESRNTFNCQQYSVNNNRAGWSIGSSISCRESSMQRYEVSTAKTNMIISARLRESLSASLSSRWFNYEPAALCSPLSSSGYPATPTAGSCPYATLATSAPTTRISWRVLSQQHNHSALQLWNAMPLAVRKASTLTGS